MAVDKPIHELCSVVIPLSVLNSANGLDIFFVFFYSVYWDYAMTIPLEEIVYLHCHQQRAFVPNVSKLSPKCQ